MSKPLDIHALDLAGTRLIEASAGTGKTWSITGIWLRHVLGIGCAPLPVENILVVTFTNAAVAELRARLRARLREALEVLDGQRDDAFLAQLLAHCDPAPARVCLRLALSSMDNAAVYTIHGFCKRVLAQYAFEARIDFDLDMQESDSELRDRAIRDFWRRHVWAGDWIGEGLVACFGHADALKARLRPLLRRDAILLPDVSEARTESLVRGAQAARERLCQAWREHRDDICTLLAQARQTKVLSGVKIKDGTLADAIDRFDRWAHDPDSVPDLRFFSRRWLEQACNKGRTEECPVHDLFDLVDEHGDVLDAKDDVLTGLLALAQTEVQRLEQTLKQRSALLTADDLIGETARALDGTRGEALATLVRDRYPVAMVDEFQDTDGLQYAIFHRLYGECPDGSLLMIGDPKQAIYGFRGADIFAYLKAREDSVETLHLDTNRRSTTAMVGAVNRLFSFDDAFVLQGLDFEPVGVADGLPPLTGDEERAALHLALPDEETATASAEVRQAWRTEWIAAEVTRLLGAGVRIGERPLRAGDIAILVRGHTDARAVRDALAARGVPAIYRGRESVLRSDEARDIQRLLEAIIEPENGQLVRNALACRLLDLPLAHLHGLIHDEQQWQDIYEQLVQWRTVWHSRGILPALYAALDHFGAFHRLRAGVLGERRLTDVLHVAELLQARHSQGDGPRELLHWLRAQWHEEGEADDVRRLRLETDDELVQIATIHGSKGLQYPVVFVAGMCAKRKAELPHAYHDDQGRLTLTFVKHQAARDVAIREGLAEDLRLLYVALTRARYRTCLLVDDIGKKKDSRGNVVLKSEVMSSAVGWLLSRGGAEADLVKAAHALAGHGISVGEDVPVATEVGICPEATPVLGPLRQLRPVDDHWRVTSYTGLLRHLDDRHAEHVNRDAAPDREPVPGTLAAFPRGARAGICMHAILERAVFPPVPNHRLSGICRQQLARAGFDERWEGVLRDMVHNVLETPFGDTGHTRLGAMQWGLPEMEYMFRADRLVARELDQGAGLLDDLLSRPALGFDNLQGMLRGFIDLVFLHDGRFWVADYKSNWLGSDPGDYTGDAMERAVAEHRYDVQALLYAVALHRYLQLTVRDYDPDQHFGGIAWLFVRGMDGTPGQGVWVRKPHGATLRRWDALLGGGA